MLCVLLLLHRRIRADNDVEEFRVLQYIKVILLLNKVKNTLSCSRVLSSFLYEIELLVEEMTSQNFDWRLIIEIQWNNFSQEFRGTI